MFRLMAILAVLRWANLHTTIFLDAHKFFVRIYACCRRRRLSRFVFVTDIAAIVPCTYQFRPMVVAMAFRQSQRRRR